MGAWKGWGGFIQFQWKDPFYIDNANFLKAPEYELVNLNFYYNVDQLTWLPPTTVPTASIRRPC
jgi:hypothetical protein